MEERAAKKERLASLALEKMAKKRQAREERLAEQRRKNQVGVKRPLHQPVNPSYITLFGELTAYKHYKN